MNVVTGPMGVDEKTPVTSIVKDMCNQCSNVISTEVAVFDTAADGSTIVEVVVTVARESHLDLAYSDIQRLIRGLRFTRATMFDLHVRGLGIFGDASETLWRFKQLFDRRIKAYSSLIYS